MGKIIVIALLAFLALAWHRGWLGEWIGDAADSGAKAVRQTQQDARKHRPAEPEEKK
jgi:hypothetical protein